MNSKFKFGRFLFNDDLLEAVIPVDPVVVFWSRLELLPYNEDLTISLQAQVADPLWMLARQWQLAESQAEDAGTPIDSRLDADNGLLSRYRPGDDDADAADYRHRQMPLEVLVESEQIRNNHPLLAARAGEHLLRLLAAEGISVSDARSTLHTAFPLDIGDDALWAVNADSQGRTWQRLFAGRAIDGSKLQQELRVTIGASGLLTSLPPSLQALGNFGAAAVLKALNAWLLWYRQFLHEPETEQSKAWHPQRQEYSLSLSARMDDKEVILNAEEYTDGRLDWYSFKVVDPMAIDTPTSSLGESDEPPEPLGFEPLVSLPAPVRYPGMPADRFWEFEDARVNLGYLEAGPTDLGRMLLAEYGMVFSNDWYMIGVPVPVGSLFRVNSLTVRDTFGVESPVSPARNFDGSRWTMFSLTVAEGLPSELQDLFFLPPAIPYRLEGEPLEKIVLIRDEMANMAWAVEQIVQGASGTAVDRRLEPASGTAHQEVSAEDIEAELVYRLMTPVAVNWLPLLPVKDDNGMVSLELHVISRTLFDSTQEEVHPRGKLLRSDLNKPETAKSPLVLNDEEVTRDDTEVQRSFEYARWLGGERFFWVGSKKGSNPAFKRSGLTFDIAKPARTED